MFVLGPLNPKKWLKMFVYVWGVNANAKILNQFFHIYLKPNS